MAIEQVEFYNEGHYNNEYLLSIPSVDEINKNYFSLKRASRVYGFTYNTYNSKKLQDKVKPVRLFMKKAKLYAKKDLDNFFIKNAS